MQVNRDKAKTYSCNEANTEQQASPEQHKGHLGCTESPSGGEHVYMVENGNHQSVGFA